MRMQAVLNGTVIADSDRTVDRIAFWRGVAVQPEPSGD